MGTRQPWGSAYASARGGSKTYILKYGAGRRGKARRVTIGRHGFPWAPETARAQARRLIGRVASGDDPAAVRAQTRRVPSVEEFARRYLDEYAAAHKKPRSVAEDIPRYKEKRRERFLSEELARLGATLAAAERDGSETPFLLGAVKLLLFNGARRSEIQTLQWPHVDFDAAVLRLPDSKTGPRSCGSDRPRSTAHASTRATSTPLRRRGS